MDVGRHPITWRHGGDMTQVSSPVIQQDRHSRQDGQRTERGSEAGTEERRGPEILQERQGRHTARHIYIPLRDEILPPNTPFVMGINFSCYMEDGESGASQLTTTPNSVWILFDSGGGWRWFPAKQTKTSRGSVCTWNGMGGSSHAPFWGEQDRFQRGCGVDGTDVCIYELERLTAIIYICRRHVIRMGQ
ncbi:hypothetical protein B0H67DRAFT_576896 [Lasiosphaeris hirsuta]|uniref:Uncharacterized protein n=1 Tax=Lasiosphaeris hirsuta TaxID=260670 RepID=A0AA40DY08_9PEZI|nr:hypothetical protein B0H67DRAFT_576896 [Lasiosphaeris hirsuta]